MTFFVPSGTSIGVGVTARLVRAHLDYHVGDNLKSRAFLDKMTPEAHDPRIAGTPSEPTEPSGVRSAQAQEVDWDDQR